MKLISIVVTFIILSLLFSCSSEINKNASPKKNKETSTTPITIKKKVIDSISISNTNLRKKTDIIAVEEVDTDTITEKPHNKQAILAYYLEDFKGVKKFIKQGDDYSIEWQSTDNIGNLGAPYTSNSILHTFIILSKKVETKFVHVLGTTVKGVESDQIHFGYVADNNDYENVWKLDQMCFTIRTTNEPIVDIYLLREYTLGFGFEEIGERSNFCEIDNLVIYTQEDKNFRKVFTAPSFSRNLVTDANGDEVWTAVTGRVELLNEKQEGYRNIHYHLEGSMLDDEGILYHDYSNYEPYFYQNNEYVNIH